MIDQEGIARRNVYAITKRASTTTSSEGMIPNTAPARPPAFDWDPTRYQVRFGRIPQFIKKGGQRQENPFRKVGVFVVHGIGQQADTDTAVSLRRGGEDAIPALDPNGTDSSANQWIVPPPYIYDGFWAKYDQLDGLWEEDELQLLTARQKRFFEKHVLARSGGWFRNCGWLVRQGWTLIRKGSWSAYPVYIPLTLFASLLYPLSVVPRLRKRVNDFVNDARRYLQPKGGAELDTVQRIDRRIGEMFLRMLGLDWDFNELADEKQLVIGGQPHRFEQPHRFDRVVWVAYSLGAVISFNVISDLLHRCRELRSTGKQITHVERVESGLRHFITLGSGMVRSIPNSSMHLRHVGW